MEGGFPRYQIGIVGIIYIQYILHSLVLIFESKCGGIRKQYFFISCFLRVLSKNVVLASEPVGGRSRATELPCWCLICAVSLVMVQATYSTIALMIKTPEDRLWVFC